MNRRAFVHQAVLAGISASAFLRPVFKENRKLANPFFVFEDVWQFQKNTISVGQAQLLRTLGFSGMEKMGLAGLEETYQQLAAQGLQLFTLYQPIELENPQQPYAAALEQALPFLGEKKCMPWLYFPSPDKKFLPSASEHDVTAVPVLRKLADQAARHQVKLMLYPHMWYWIESVDDAIRVVKKVDRPNLGITFNLCHYLAHCYTHQLDVWKKLPGLIDQALPHLFAMSINGADLQPQDPKNIWQSFIQPLGSGDFDTYLFLKLFLDKGFTGPIGLQCYNIDLPPEKQLKQSSTTWQLYKKRYQTGP